MIDSETKLKWLNRALDHGKGVVRLTPTWVPRGFVQPGGRMRLDLRDFYVLGAERGCISERWLGSTVQADNGPTTPDDEGLSYIAVHEGNKAVKILLRDAIVLMGDRFLGRGAMEQYGGWVVLAKLFDNAGPLFFHLHQQDKDVRSQGKRGKPEAYYFPPQLNHYQGRFPYTFFGLRPGTSRDDVRRCLARWKEGDNRVHGLSQAYQIVPGTGWNVPAGILHAPGSLVTYELQQASDVASIFQSWMGGRPVPQDLLYKDVTPDRRGDVDAVLDLIDWEANLDPGWVRGHYREPELIGDDDATAEAGFVERWIAHDSPCFSGKELTVFPGREMNTKEDAAYVILVLQGQGTVGEVVVEAPSVICYGEPIADELFVTRDAAGSLEVKNLSQFEDLVLLKHFGPVVKTG